MVGSLNNKKLEISHSMFYWWLRSACSSYYGKVGYVRGIGSVGGCGYGGLVGVATVCVI